MALDENAVRRYQRALLKVWDGADAATRGYGAAWYGQARCEARALADRYGFTVAQAAGVIAALSPRVDWRSNLADAKAVLSWAEDCRDGLSVPDGGPRDLHAFRANVLKAIEVVALEDPLSALHGPKQRAFYRNIIGDTHAVTVDVWAARAATYGKQDGPRSAADYDCIARAYVRAARSLGTTPRDLQAACWVAARGAAQ